MLRKWNLGLALFAFGWLFHAPVFAEDVRIGIMPYPLYASLIYARQMGWVEEEVKKVSPSTKVQWKQFVSGGPMSEGLASGDLDTGVLGSAPAIIGRASGQDSRIVAVVSTSPTSHALVARSALNITTVAQLKGRKVATLFGSTVYELLVRALGEAGLGPNDAQLLHMGPDDMAVALRSGSIDGAVIWDPLLPTLLKEGTVKVLRDGKGINDNITVLIVRGPYLQANKEIVKATVRAMQRANDAITKDPKAVATALAPAFKMNVDEAETMMRKYSYSMPITPTIKDQLTKSVAFMNENKIIRRSISLDGFVDTSALPPR